MEVLQGLVDKIYLKKDTGFIIFDMKSGHQTIRVTGDDSDIHESDVVRCEGHFSVFQGREQFKAKMIIPQIPSTTEAILDFLASGRIKGIKTKTATKLIKVFGKDLIRIVEKEPERLKEVSGFGPAKIKLLVEGLNDQIGFRSLLIFLHNFGLKKRVINKIFKTYGISAVEKLQSNPYSLCREVEGIGFKTADMIGLKAGIRPDDPNRVMAGIGHALNVIVNSSGNTCSTREKLTTAAFNLFSNTRHGIDHKTISDGIDVLIESPLAVVRVIDGLEYIFPSYLDDAESSIASHLNRLIKHFKPRKGLKHVDSLLNEAEATLGIEGLAEAQKEAVVMALASPVSVITGGPGTGKTTIVRAFLEITKNGFGIKQDDILLCAPTGKAAKRLAESSGMETMTLHRALSYAPENDGFLHNEDQPLEAKIILIDEYSMVDTQLADWFVQAIASGTQLIIVGDVDQLASVGAGKVLKDLIDSGVIPVTRLTEIYRQAKGSKIITNSHLINQGLIPVVDMSDPANDFWFIRAKRDNEIAESIIGLFDRLSKHFNYDPIEDIQVLTAMRRGPVGMYEMNRRLQKLLNPNLGKGVKLLQDGVDVELCKGDKVIHIKNNYEMEVYNGEVGRIHSVDDKARKLVVLYEHRLVEYKQEDLDQLRLAYCMTIHKAQGSEYPCVIIPITSSHYTMLSRNLYYTGITRAKRTFVGVGQMKAFEIASKVVSSDSRTTGLRQKLLEEFGLNPEPVAVA
ncbi:ATP-dependent RecD-like DNA helicase [Pseudomonas luteola]